MVKANQLTKEMLLKQTIGHFCVDASCAAIVIGGTQGIFPAVWFFVLYNFCAFCLQPFAGIILDKCKNVQPKQYILASFVMLLTGFVCPLNMWIRTLIIGIGNCLFHTGAGTIILNQSGKKMAPLGIFVSSGAVGLLMGTWLAYEPLWHSVLIFSLLILILLNWELPTKIKIPKQSIKWMLAWALCLCIAIRSYMGFVPLTQFKKTPLIVLIITLGVFAGKSLGGILCDKFGIRKVVLISSAFVIGLFLFSFQNPCLWTTVQIIVNLSMPITLYLMYKSMPGYPAFSFGLAASFLTVGYLATWLLRNFSVPNVCFLGLFALNSAIILFAERKLR